MLSIRALTLRLDMLFDVSICFILGKLTLHSLRNIMGVE